MNRPRLSPARVAALVAAFILFRAALFAVTTANEHALYRAYGEAARSTSLAELYRTRDIEYPHLAVEFGALACAVADALPDWAPRLTALRPNPTLGEDAARYEVALGIVLFAVDVGCLVLVFLVARRVYPHEGPFARVGRLVAYTVTTGALGLILYDRQDLVVALLALLALWALAAGRPALGYAALTVGTGYKLVPALLLPVWVLAAAAARAAPNATPARYLRAVVLEAAVAAAILAAWPVLTYAFGGGERGFVFLTFHSARGLQLEAPAAWPVPLLDPSTEVGHGYGSYNLRGGLADRVAGPTRLAMPLAVLLAVGVAARGFWRFAAGTQYPVPSTERDQTGDRSRTGWSAPASTAGTVPRTEKDRTGYWVLGTRYSSLVSHVVAASLLVWLGFILTNKVGSPQYMLWVAPLVPLLPLRSSGERWWAGLMLAVFLFTTLIFPCRYYQDIIGPRVGDDPLTWAGPSALGLFLLAAKSVTLAVATVWLAVSVWRSPRIELLPPAESTS